MDAFTVNVYASADRASDPRDFYACQVPRRSACADACLDLVGRACGRWGGLVDSPPLASAASNPATRTCAQIQPATAATAREDSGRQQTQGFEAPGHKPPATGLMMSIVRGSLLFAPKLLAGCVEGKSHGLRGEPQVFPWPWTCREVENASAGFCPGKPCVR